MSARLCYETPPKRTLGDDLESFALLLLWLAGGYAANDMSPLERWQFLRRFDSWDGDAKAGMFGSGSTIANRLKLSSNGLTYLLEDLLDGYRYRYTKLTEREQKIPGKLAAHEHHQARLENHEWLMGLLSEALKDEEWKESSDPSRKEQEVAPLNQRETWRKRKSACSEYELTNASKRLRLAEHNGTEEDEEEDVDTEDDEDNGEEDDEDNGEEDNEDDGEEEDEEDGDEQNDDDGDDEEV